MSTSFFAFSKYFLIFVVKQTMTVALEIRIGDLLTEFLANTLVVFGTLQAAGAISPGTLQAVTDGLYHFFIFIQSHCHVITSFVFIIPRLSRAAIPPLQHPHYNTGIKSI